MEELPSRAGVHNAIIALAQSGSRGPSTSPIFKEAQHGSVERGRLLLVGKVAAFRN